MMEIPSRKGFAGLTEAANSIVPVVTLGFAQSRENGSVSIVYSYPHGFGEYAVAPSDLLDALQPSVRAALRQTNLPNDYAGSSLRQNYCPHCSRSSTCVKSSIDCLASRKS